MSVLQKQTHRKENTKQKKERSKLEDLDFLKRKSSPGPFKVLRKSHHIWQGTKQVIYNRTQGYMLKYGMLIKSSG